MKLLKIIGLWLLLPFFLLLGAVYGFGLVSCMVVAATVDIWKGPT